MKKIVQFILLVLMGISAAAQTTPPGNNPQTPPVTKKKKAKTPPSDGFGSKKEIDSAVFVPYAEVREEDVFYAKRVWQEIDLRDTINALFRSPKSRLMDVLLLAVRDGELSAYNPKDSLFNDNDDFKTMDLLEPDSAVSMALGFSNIEKNGVVTRKVNSYPLDYNAEAFYKFRLKEDWILDVRRSVFEPRIVGLAPLKYNEDAKQWQPVFWIYFPEAREMLSKKKAMNSNNDASTLSFDDIFIRRLFAANIVKESNAGDKKFSELIADPRLRLLE
ncbi:MAG: gliding motility protein GldN, partial [Sphingobacteriales bacterium]